MVVQQSFKPIDLKVPACFVYQSLSKELENNEGKYRFFCPLGGITTIVCYWYAQVAPLATSAAHFVSGNSPLIHDD